MTTDDKLLKEMRTLVMSSLKPKLDLLGFDLAEIDDETNLTGSGIIDSMGFVILIGEIENEFDYEIDLGEYEPEEFTTLGGLLKCAIESKVNA